MDLGGEIRTVLRAGGAKPRGCLKSGEAASL
jgi:hypothetical protein